MWKYYRTRRTLQTSPRPTITFSHRWDTLAEQRFANCEEVEKWFVEWFALKEKNFFCNGIHDWPERWAKCVESNGKYFE